MRVKKVSNVTKTSKFYFSDSVSFLWAVLWHCHLNQAFTELLQPEFALTWHVHIKLQLNIGNLFLLPSPDRQDCQKHFNKQSLVRNSICPDLREEHLCVFQHVCMALS